MALIRMEIIHLSTRINTDILSTLECQIIMPARLLERLKIGPDDTFIAHPHDYCLQANFPAVWTLCKLAGGRWEKYEAPLDM